MKIRQILGLVTSISMGLSALALLIYNIRVADVALHIDNFELFMGWFFNFIAMLFFIFGTVMGLLAVFKYPNGRTRLFNAASMPLAIYMMILTVSTFTIGIVNEKIQGGDVALLVFGFIVFIGLLTVSSLKANRNEMPRLITGEIFAAGFLIIFIIKMNGLDVFFSVMMIITVALFMVEMPFLTKKYDIEGAAEGPVKLINGQQNGMNVSGTSSQSVYDELPRGNSHVIDFSEIPHSTDQEDNKTEQWQNRHFSLK